MSGRIRTVKPEWLEDELLAAATDEARVLSIGLILVADDYGNGRASIATIAAEVWRYALERDDGAGAPEVLAKASRAFRELLAIGFIGTWSEGGQRYFTIRNWARHQRVDKPGKPLVPKPPIGIFDVKTEDSGKTPEPVASNSGESPESLRPDLRPVPTTNDHGGAHAPDVAAVVDLRVPCPADLMLTDGQLATLVTSQVPIGAIEQVTRSFVASNQADPGDKRTLVVWRKCLSQAVSAKWNDARFKQEFLRNQREVKPDADDTGGWGKASDWQP